MKMLTFAALLALLALPVFAQSQPDPMLRQLDWFAVDYKCTGIAFATPMAPEHATRATVAGSWTLDGRWVRFTYAEKKTPQNPKPFSVSGFFGYDAEIRKLVIGAVDNMGGYATGASDGWNGDTIVFTGPWHLGTQTVNARDTFTKTGSNKMTHTGELEMNGKWITLAKDECTRVKK